MISGPSGTGKSSIIKALRNQVNGLGYTISHTTRAPRSTEQEGVDYHFVDRDRFLRMIDSEGFVEWAEVYGHLYGTSFCSLNEQMSEGSDVLLDIDSQGADHVRSRFESSVLVYVLPPSLEVLEKRLRERGTDDENTISRRMDEAIREIKNCTRYDYVIINEDLECAIEHTKAIVVSDRCRTKRNERLIRDRFGIRVP